TLLAARRRLASRCTLSLVVNHCCFDNRIFDGRTFCKNHNIWFDTCDLCTCAFIVISFLFKTSTNKLYGSLKVDQVSVCGLPNKLYKNQASLKQHHRRDHLRHRPYACSLCTKDFFNKSDFDYHMRLSHQKIPDLCHRSCQDPRPRSHQTDKVQLQAAAYHTLMSKFSAVFSGDI
ncbi:unnamed protein product, partial [Meganyctiphanes norvegica]